MRQRNLKESERDFLTSTLMRDNERLDASDKELAEIGVENTAVAVTPVGDKPTPTELYRRLDSLEGELRHLEKKFNEFFDSKAKPKGF
jgi:hypothetical protein